MKSRALLLLLLPLSAAALGYGVAALRSHFEPAKSASHADDVVAEPPVVEGVALLDLSGRRVVIGRDAEGAPGVPSAFTFWCTTCHSCRSIERTLAQRAAGYAARGAYVAAIASNTGDGAERVRRFLERERLEFPVLLDDSGDAMARFSATVTTTTVVIDAAGRLVYRGSFAGAEAALEDLLAGRPVAVPESRAVG